MYIDNASKQICDGHNWIMLFSFMKPKNCSFQISFNKASWSKNIWPANAGDFLYSPKTTFPSQCLSFFIITLCVCLMISMFRGEIDVLCMQFHALIQFIICLENLLTLFGKKPTSNKFHISLKKNFATASPSKSNVPYTNMTLRSFINSSTYG